MIIDFDDGETDILFVVALQKRGFNRLIDKIFMSPKSGKHMGSKIGTPLKSPAAAGGGGAAAPSPSPARDAQGFAVPSPQVRTPNMIARQASIRHMNMNMNISGLNSATLTRQVRCSVPRFVRFLVYLLG